MAIVGRGRILVWEGASLWVFSVERDRDETDFHAHHAIQVTFSLGGEYELRTRSEVERGPAVAVAPDREHQFAASGATALLFIEPEGAIGGALRQRWFADRDLRSLEVGTLSPLLDELARQFQLDGDEETMIAIGKKLLAALGDNADAHGPDRRVRQMIDYVSSNLEQAVSLTEAAGHACLSPDRASHLFVEQVGLPFRTYVLWRRVKRAVEIYSDGAPLTVAAHDAGFADSAHLSRTFRRMFGLSAASLRLIAPG